MSIRSCHSLHGSPKLNNFILTHQALDRHLESAKTVPVKYQAMTKKINLFNAHFIEGRAINKNNQQKQALDNKETEDMAMRGLFKMFDGLTNYDEEVRDSQIHIRDSFSKRGAKLKKDFSISSSHSEPDDNRSLKGGSFRSKFSVNAKNSIKFSNFKTQKTRNVLKRSQYSMTSKQNFCESKKPSFFAISKKVRISNRMKLEFVEKQTEMRSSFQRKWKKLQRQKNHNLQLKEQVSKLESHAEDHFGLFFPKQIELDGNEDPNDKKNSQNYLRERKQRLLEQYWSFNQINKNERCSDIVSTSEHDENEGKISIKPQRFLGFKGETIEEEEYKEQNEQLQNIESEGINEKPLQERVNEKKTVFFSEQFDHLPHDYNIPCKFIPKKGSIPIDFPFRKKQLQSKSIYVRI